MLDSVGGGASPRLHQACAPPRVLAIEGTATDVLAQYYACVFHFTLTSRSSLWLLPWKANQSIAVVGG